MGEWLVRYGESIYGTRGGDVPPHDWGVTTRKGDRLYVHVLDSPDDVIFLPLECKVVSAICLNDGNPVKFDTVKGNGILLHVPDISGEPDRIIELVTR